MMKNYFSRNRRSLFIFMLLACMAFAVYFGAHANAARFFTKAFASRTHSSTQRQLSFADRVTYQRAIEEVYWRHRIWPAERTDPKPALNAVMPAAEIQKKVEDYLLNSQALEDYWRQPLTAEQLQGAMERMAQQTKQPEVLRELFEALGNDPFVIAECLARPTLAERLVIDLYAHDERFHGELKQRAEVDLRAHHSVNQMKQSSGHYNEVEWVRTPTTRDSDGLGSVSTASGSDRVHANSLRMNSYEWKQNIETLAAMFDKLQLVAAQKGGAYRTERQAEAYRTQEE